MTRAAPSLLCFLAASSLTALAAGQGFEPPNSLPWPLYIDDGGAYDEPREALGNAFGEYQDAGGHVYLHTGIDIRGNNDDIVKVVADGNIWVSVNYDDDGCELANTCRLYLKGSASDARYIYYYAHLALHTPDDAVTASMRSKILAATAWNDLDPEAEMFPVNDGTDVTAGSVLSHIGPFFDGFSHLHFGIVDSEQNYDAINPLTALVRTQGSVDIIDDEPPVVGEIQLFSDGTHTDVTPASSCTPISGQFDIAASMYDSFYTENPAPQDLAEDHLSRFGVYRASYTARNVKTGASTAGTWYELDRAPLDCAGPNRGLACPVPVSEAGFAAHSFFFDSSMLIMGEPYSPVLFAEGLSHSNWGPGSVEYYVHLLTNAWGLDGNWDTSGLAEGYYQVTALARDEAGNATPRTRYFTVANDGATDAVADAHVRDNPDDVGNIPSTVGGRPFWTSPDIFIVQAGEVPDIQDDPEPMLLLAGVDYDVFLRVHNQSCAPVSNIGAQVYSANPAMFQDEDDWVYITEEGEYEGTLDLDDFESGFLGPFPWTPTEAEATANAGHRCLRARINAVSDPDSGASVPDNNNFTQRNIEFGVTSFDFDNPGIATASIGTELRCNGFPFSKKGAVMELRVAYHSALWAAWQNMPGATVTLASFPSPTIIVRFKRCNVVLPAANLPPNTHLAASFKAVLPPKTPGSWTIDLHGYWNGQHLGGMSFLAKAP